MKTSLIFSTALFLSLFASCAKVKNPPEKIKEEVILKNIEVTPDPFEATAKFMTEQEFVLLKGKLFDEAITRLDLEKIDFDKHFMIRGDTDEKKIETINYSCRYEVRNDQFVTFGSDRVSKIFVTYVSKILDTKTSVDFCQKKGKQLNVGYALVFKRPSVEQYIAEIKDAFSSGTKDIFNILSVGRNHSESFGIILNEDSEHLSLKVLGNKGTKRELLNIKPEITNPEAIFNAYRPVTMEEINYDQAPDDMVISVYKFDLFYAGNMRMKDFSDDFVVSSANLKQYINNQMQQR